MIRKENLELLMIAKIRERISSISHKVEDKNYDKGGGVSKRGIK